MPNVTLSVTEELHNKMKKHSEIRWSEVVRRSITEQLSNLELLDRIASKSRLTKKDVTAIADKIDSNVAKRLGLKCK